jgi:chromosome partitioning protein
MRNDHQDALAAGLAVCELSPFGKSSDEIRDLWRWIETRLNGGIVAGAEAGSAVAAVEFPIILSPDYLKTKTENALQPLSVVSDEAGTWDAVF